MQESAPTYAGGDLSPPMIPSTLAATSQIADWRERLAWPLSQQARTDIALQTFNRLFDWLSACPEGRLKDSVSLGSVRFLGAHAKLLIAASELSEAQTQGMVLSETTSCRPAPSSLAAPSKRSNDFVSSSAGELLRNLRAFATSARQTSRWTSSSRLAMTVLKPDAVVLSQNSLMRSEITKSQERLRSVDAATLLRQAPRAHHSDVPELQEFARQWSHDLVADCGFDDAAKDRLRSELCETALIALEEANSDLERLSLSRHLPARVWSATGGRYATRAVSIACHRRDGEIVRFAHGGAPVFDGYPEILTYVDLMACTTFVAPTKGAAQVIHRRLPETVRPKTEIVSGNGDPKFAIARRASKPSRAVGQPTVVYCPTIFVGSACHFPPMLPDPIYLDWQLRLVETLAKLPITLKGRPHPENLVILGRQPLDPHLETVGGDFANALEQADTLVFDWPLSTSFWEALCSDCHVVLLNICNASFNRDNEDLICERCIIVDTSFDDRNRPVVDVDAIAAALQFDGPAPDPSPIRALLWGEE